MSRRVISSEICVEHRAECDASISPTDTIIFLITGRARSFTLNFFINAECQRFALFLLCSGFPFLVLLKNWSRRNQNIRPTGTKYGLGSWRFGEYLRSAHILQRRRLCYHDQRCEVKLGLRAAILEQMEGIREMREAFVITRKSFIGPFAKAAPIEKIQDMVGRCWSLFHEGPPVGRSKWYMGPGRTPKQYGDISTQLIGRTCPAPRKNRWYSCETTARHMTAALAFDVFTYVFPMDTVVLRMQVIRCSRTTRITLPSQRRGYNQYEIVWKVRVADKICFCAAGAEFPDGDILERRISTGGSGRHSRVPGALGVLIEGSRIVISGRNPLAN